MMERIPVFKAAIWAASLGWCNVVWMLWTGPGVHLYFGGENRFRAWEANWSDPSALVVLILVAVALWLILRRVRRGRLVGRATLWSSVSGMAFVWIGGTLAARHPDDWMLWAGPPVLGAALLVLALEPFLSGEE